MKYMAEDGKVFETMAECEQYEKDLAPNAAMEDVKKNVILYNSNGEEIPYDFGDIHSFFTNLNRCVYEDSFFIKVLHNLTTGQDFVDFPTGAGTYRWYDDDRWIDIDDDIDMFIYNWKSIFPNMHVVKGE